MPTFLENCQQLHRECKVSGTLSSTVGQTGRLLDLVSFIQKANRKIMNRKSNWKFLWAQWDLTLVVDIADYTPVSGLSAFDLKSFWLDATSAEDATPIPYVDWKYYRDHLRPSFQDADETSYVTLTPSGTLKVIPAPDTTQAGSVLSSEYWKAPVDLTDDDQVSLIPEQFHDLIVSQAKVYYAERISNTGMYQSAFVEHESMYRDLKAHSLPGKQDDRSSENTTPMIVTVI